MNEKLTRLIIFIFTAFLHIAVIFFLVFETKKNAETSAEFARVMKLTDVTEMTLPPPIASDPEIPQVEEIAETMTETDTPLLQEVVAAGTLNVIVSEENYLPMHMVSVRPAFDENAILSSITYPPIAFRSGIEGRVMLELFVDRSGVIQRITIILEEPEGRGFGEAAVRAFTGRTGSPALANGEPVSCRFRYPVTFTIK